MSFTPTNKTNLNQDNIDTSQKNSFYNSNSENLKTNPNFLIEDNSESNKNLIYMNNNNCISNKNNIFNNLLNSNLNQIENSNIKKQNNSEYNIKESPKVNFDEVIENMNNYINQYIYMGFYQNALFYAEKVFFLTLKREEEICNLMNLNNPNNNHNPIINLSEQLYNFANCLFLNKEYFRCVNLIQKYNMTYFNIKFLNLLGQALFASEDYESVIEYLDKPSIEYIENLDNNENQITSNDFHLSNQGFNINTNKTRSPTNNHHVSFIQNPYTKTSWNQNPNECLGNSNFKKSNLKNRDITKETNKMKNITPVNINLNNNFNNTTRKNLILNNLMNSNYNGININNNATPNNNADENKSSTSSPNNVSEKINSIYQSAKCLIVAKAFEMQENKDPAIRNYMDALRYDAGNIEAFESLINHNLFTNEQKLKLTQDLVFDKNNMWLFDYFYSKSMDNIFITEKSECLNSLNIISVFDPNDKNQNLEENIEEVKVNILDILYTKKDQDLMKIEAEKYFKTRDYYGSYINLKKINEDDFYKLDIIPMYCSCLIELNKVGELYYLAHKLANNCPDKFVSWFAVGCYYYCVNKFEIAKKYFARSNQINKHFPEGLIALGNCYAAQDELDQALSAYRTCLRLFPGCHTANLYVGMEYAKSNNLRTALLAFQEAFIISNSDPLVYNEIGVIYYKQKIYEKAKEYFLEGIKACKEDKSYVYQSLTINLGHTLRKLKDYNNAIFQYDIVIKMDTRNVNVLTALAYTYHLRGDYVKALDIYHKVNFIKSDDSFTIEMINKCLNDLVMYNEKNEIFGDDEI